MVAQPTDQWSELLPPYTTQQAVEEAHRCLYCAQAPCLQACPTHIDIPTFIRRIGDDNVMGAATAILDANFLGGTCARVCPVEELCQGACVMNEVSEPIQIGRLQRHAVDTFNAAGVSYLVPGPSTGRRVLIVGSGPAGLSAAAELIKAGHQVVMYERDGLGGGLSSYGIVTLREPLAVAQGEVEALVDAGLDLRTGTELAGADGLSAAAKEFDAVLLTPGAGGTGPLRIDGEEHVIDGLDFVRQAKLAPESLPQLRHAVVIGAGNTAIDAATMAVRSGARTTIVYRRGADDMTAYDHEYAFALSEGIVFDFYTQPIGVEVIDGQVSGLRVVSMAAGEPDASGRPAPVMIPGSERIIACDAVIKANGQAGTGIDWGVASSGRFITVDEQFRTSLAGVWAAGDAVRAAGSASTVMAVQDGKFAAASITSTLDAKEA